jgi:hypothetical protein
MRTSGAGAPAPRRRGRTPAGAWLVAPVLIVALAALLAVVASPVISWALGEGTPGIFVARFLDCHKGCAWIGEFISSDPKTAVPDVRLVNLHGLPELKPGDTVHAVHVSSLYGSSAYPGRPSLRDVRAGSIWPFELLALLLLAVFAGWIWTVPVRYYRWRLRGATDLPGFTGRRRVIPPPWSRQGHQPRTR